MKWNLAEAFEALVPVRTDAPCLVQGDRTLSWSEVDRRVNALGNDLLAAGLGPQAKVAAYLRNCPEYLETYLASFKAGLVPVNTNFRYGPAEIRYLFDDADAEAVIVEAEYLDVVDEVRPALPEVKRWYVVGGEAPEWAIPYESVVASADGECRPEWGRSPDDIILLYTGGTTGMPKGVMWPQHDLFTVLRAGANPVLGTDAVTSYAELASGIVPMTALPACPLMHGTGQFSALIALLMGGTVVVLPPGHLDVVELFDTVERHRVQSLVIVGDAFARPMIDHLDAHPGRHDLSSLRLVTSSGVMWSREVKEALLAHLSDGALLFDSLGSSEGVGFGASVSAKGAEERTARFMLGPHVKVFADDGREIGPGSSEAGMLALGGPIPIGYYKDPDKTAATFRSIDGVRYSIPGDWATVNADGTLNLLGRGSVCINTGGEKVFPEEVEEALKLADGVVDAVCVGVPDERFGERVVAIVEPAPAAELEPEALIDAVKSRLAHYKAPREVLVVASISRAPNGKVDYKRWKAYATGQPADS